MNILYDETLFTSENNNAGSGCYRTNTIQNTGQTQILCVICCVLYCNGQQTKKWSDVSKCQVYLTQDNVAILSVYTFNTRHHCYNFLNMFNDTSHN